MTRRRLSPEERDLWSRYSRTADPLHPTARDKPVQKSLARPLPDAPQPLPRFQIGQKAGPRDLAHRLAPSVSDEVRSAPLRMDAKAHKKMSAGKLRPEGKLDLHGMTLDAAHPALTRFVMKAHAQGKRLIIVVTGKGRPGTEDGPIPVRQGILRHQVPQWLRTQPLASVVLQVSEAHRRHGGSGAYYVYLRRLR